MNKLITFGHLLHGGDYNPEQWLEQPEILEKDLEYFKKAGINTVTIGMFSWAVLEPEEGVFRFDWMEDIINKMHKNGISVILGTPSGARPKWMSDRYPEVLRVTPDRRRNLFGLRHNHCYTSPVYREKVRIMNTKLTEKFGAHPAVILWHLSNEYGGECHCPLCQEEFRSWLKRRYGTIENLNRAWCTTFWSHIYQSFEQVESPSPIGENSLHGLNLDWKRFVTDRTLDFARFEIQAIRDAGSDKPVTTNLMYDYEGLNPYKWKDVVDIISWDNYPTWHKEAESHTAMDCGMQHDIMRSIQKKPYLLMESCPSATNWQKVSKLKKPGMAEAAALQAIAHGSDSVLYFQLRQSQGSSEKFHGAVIDHYGGDDARVFKEVSKTGEALKTLEFLAGTDIKSQAAVIYDWENRWAMEDSQGPRNQNLYYKESVEKSYQAFRRMGWNVDVIDMEQDLDEYKVVAAPMLYMFRAGWEKKARKFVENGGTLFMTYWSGIVDESDRCFLGGTPYGLMDVMGIRSMEIDGLYDGEKNCALPVKGSSLEMKYCYACEHLCDLVKPSTAETLMVYERDFYQGMPAVTCNHYGQGKAYYICADMEPDFYEAFYRKAAEQQGMKPRLETIPAGIEITGRESDEAEYWIVQNFNREDTKIELPLGQYEICFGRYDGEVRALETVVLKRKK